MIELFGFEFKRKDQDKPEPPSFSPREFDDGATAVAAAGAFGTFIDLDGTVRSEAEVVNRYRQMAEQAEIDNAVDEIINEMIAGEYNVKIILDDVEQNDVVKKALVMAFEEVLELLDARLHLYDVVKRWYIDGRLYFHVIIDEQNTVEGIQEIRYIDPRKIRKIREIIKRQVRGSAVTAGDAVLTQTKNEYFLYSDRGFNFAQKAMQNPASGGGATNGLKIAKDAVVHVTSGLTDSLGSMVLSYLHKAIKPLNQLRTLEDAAIIYRLSRSPERRIWYIDIGNLPKMKAEQYVKDIMNKHKNKLNYNAETGEIRNEHKFINMLEDYWLPQREGKGTKVDVLPPGAAFNQLDDILFFQKKLYSSLHVPISRLDPNNLYNADIATQITRDEVKFGKFIERLRTRFSQLFVKVMEKQIVLKKIMTIEDFQIIAPYLKFDFVKDNYFLEGKEQMIMAARLELAMSMSPFVGRYYSNEWLRENILKQSEEEIKEMDAEIAEEMNDPQFMMPLGQDPNAMDDPNNPAVIADSGSFDSPSPELSNGNGQSDGKGQLKSAGPMAVSKLGANKSFTDTQKVSKTKNKPNNFKSVAAILSKGT